MRGMNRRFVGVVAMLVGIWACGQVAMASLATDSNAMAGWHGSTDFIDASGTLRATIDYAVYAPGEFAVSFPSSGYAPAPSPLGLPYYTYAYQIHVTGSAPLTQLTIAMSQNNKADHIATFGDLAGIAPDDLFFGQPYPDPVSANWVWYAGMNAAQSGSGLVYSSVNVPRWTAGTIQDDGHTAAMDLPSPANNIPEPSAVGLLAVGAGLGLWRRRRN